MKGSFPFYKMSLGGCLKGNFPCYKIIFDFQSGSSHPTTEILQDALPHQFLQNEGPSPVVVGCFF